MERANYKQVESEIDSIYKESEIKIKELANKYRNDILLPLCKKHKLTFTSNFGTFYFFDNKVINLQNAIKLKRKYLIPILNTLMLEVNNNIYDCFGYYIENITLADIS